MILWVGSSDHEKNVNENILSLKRKMSGNVTAPAAKRHSTTMGNSEMLDTTPKDYTAPKVLRDAAPYQHVRMFSDIVSGVIPLIQAADKDSSEPAHMKIEVMNNTDKLEVN